LCSIEYTKDKTLSEYLSGQGLALTFMWIVYYLSSGFIFGFDTTISQSYGAKQFVDCGKQLQTGVAVTLATMIPVGVLWLFAGLQACS
jgi:Na+-driven multidrug efflux pump